MHAPVRHTTGDVTDARHALALGTLLGRCDNVPPTARSVAEGGTHGYFARGGKIVATTAVVHSPRLWR
jgi:hypothetical protein